MMTLNTSFFVALVLAQSTLKAALNPPSNGEFDTVSRLFIWCDVLSAVSSLLVAACVVWAKLGGGQLAHDAREFSAAFLVVAMFMMYISYILALHIRSPEALPIFDVGMFMFFTGVFGLIMLVVLFRTRWSRLASFVLGRA